MANSGKTNKNGERPVVKREAKDALSQKVLELKKKLNAVILAHNYQIPQIQDIADFVGDSLGLSRQASQTDADVIVFCGVHFMAETAKILNPEKVVILPDEQAGCSLEESCPPDKLKELQDTNRNFYTISYINCSAAVKALSDIICTSGNAVKVVSAAPKDRDLLFVPDENLGEWVMEKTGRKMTLWKGNCYVHIEFSPDTVRQVKRQHPDAPILVHPECLKSVRILADEVCSTEKMIDYCKQSASKSFIIVTEPGMIHRLKKECPNKEFISVSASNGACNECKYMKMNTMEKLLACMENLNPRVELSKEIIEKARLPIERMLAI
ncbi:MAG TPA: quinolinate synthase NadA [Verrucomicrobiota bacterium]|nr:quinolinate synthase NadA [Verrucomicrobiota bacterium]